MRIIKVSVNDFKIHGFHGVHPLEKRIGCFFIVDLYIEFNCNNVILNLEESVDYEILLNIIKKQMNQTRDLLESVCQSILDEVFEKFSQVIVAEITIKKVDPLIDNFKGNLTVSMKQVQ